MAAKIVRDLKSLPERGSPIPGAKPPVTSFPFQDDPGSPDEADEFLRFVRRLRRYKLRRECSAAVAGAQLFV
jgi:hypothetical protein